MRSNIIDQLQYYSFESFPSEQVIHGIFTRKGGVSPAPWNTLNIGGNNGDPRENVIENRKRMFEALELRVETIFDVWQVHSAEVVCTDIPRPLDAPHFKADAILTNKPGVTLLMRFGDCVPILLYDPPHHVIGLVHAGWLGTVRKTLAATIQTMKMKYSTIPEDIIAGIGPSIGPDHYEVGEDVIKHGKLAFETRSEELFFKNSSSQIHFDLWAANKLILEQSGVKNIQVAQICTACHFDEWFSHRAEKAKTGRFGVLIALR